MEINSNIPSLPMIQFTELKQERFDTNKYAPMEDKTLKIRNKLEKRLSQLDEKMTEKRISQTKKKMHLWIERHSSERTPIKKESFHLFTGGKNAAPISRGIANIRKRLEEGLSNSLSSNLDLRGRVKKSI